MGYNNNSSQVNLFTSKLRCCPCDGLIVLFLRSQLLTFTKERITIVPSRLNRSKISLKHTDEMLGLARANRPAALSVPGRQK